jgi:hypothetical protein
VHFYHVLIVFDFILYDLPKVLLLIYIGGQRKALHLCEKKIILVSFFNFLLGDGSIKMFVAAKK